MKLISCIERILRIENWDIGPKRFFAFLVLNTISWQSLISTILVLHARALGMPPVWTSVLFSMLFFAGALAFFTKPLAEKYGSRRVLVSGWFARYLFVTPVVFIPLVAWKFGTYAAGILLFVSTTFFCILRALAQVAWTSWLQEILPHKIIGRWYELEYISTRFILVVSGILAFFVFGKNPELWRFSIFTAVGVICGFISVTLLRKCNGGLPVPGDTVKHTLLSGYRETFASKDLMPFVIGATFFLSFAISAELLVPLLLRDTLGFGAGPILMLLSIGNFLAIFTTPRWRKIADRHGSPVVMSANAIIVAASCAVLALLPAEKSWWRVFAAVVACAFFPTAVAANSMATARGFLLRMDDKLRHANNAVWNMITQVSAGVVTVFVGYILSAGESTAWPRYVAFGFAGVGLILALYGTKMAVPIIDALPRPSPVYNPSHPLLGIIRVTSYVLAPHTHMRAPHHIPPPENKSEKNEAQ